MDDNINIDISDKSEDVDNSVKSDNYEETLEDVVNGNFLKTKQSHQNLLRWKNQKGMISCLVGDLCGYGRGC